MKKTLTLLLLILITVCLVTFIACNKKGNEYYKAEYLTGAIGSIEGKTNQTVIAGEATEEVTAVPDEGYVFDGWSDGVKESTRSDVLDGDISVTAEFRPIKSTVHYVVEEGGQIYGTTLQDVVYGEGKSSEVEVEANVGYRFVGWSDGKTDRVRAEENLLEDVTLIARFERIYVNFYSETELVRQIPLDSLYLYDYAKLKGYKSCSDFTGWAFTDDFITLNPDAANTDNPLKFLADRFTKSKDIEDITLNATYTDNAETVFSGNKTVAHALGSLDGEKYLSTKEAFIYNYENGQRFFEVDFSLTTDNYVVVAHSDEGFTLSYAEFMAKSTVTETFMNLADFVALMVEYPDAYFDFDLLSIYCSRGGALTIEEAYDIFFTEFSGILGGLMDSAEVLSRIVVEISPNERDMLISKAQLIGITEYMYLDFTGTNYINERSINSITALNEAIEWCNLNGVTRISTQTINPEYFEILKDNGIDVYVFTVNDIFDAYYLYDIGVQAIFTDYLII